MVQVMLVCDDLCTRHDDSLIFGHLYIPHLSTLFVKNLHAMEGIHDPVLSYRFLHCISNQMRPFSRIGRSTNSQIHRARIYRASLSYVRTYLQYLCRAGV